MSEVAPGKVRLRLEAPVTPEERETIRAAAKLYNMSEAAMLVQGVRHIIDLLDKQSKGLTQVFIDAHGYALPTYNQQFTGYVKWQTSPTTSVTSRPVQATPVRANLLNK